MADYGRLRPGKRIPSQRPELPGASAPRIFCHDFLFESLTTLGVNPFTYGRTSASQQDVFTRLQVT
jgi:hypothetical protein